ncbi:phosphopantetheine-binding protein [Desulfobulbus propionicus DSM 2032]|jgi:Phosphopantetheine attachment site.|uniref:Phosphopantetheine-binding protein n=1 Tax=Desulfobulbus propionicus (strain ATCC 33891 / DSM 2032 / VKM B-1956 / 1pr3) TaxID=577650 RepID=A0A7U4DQN4_DESPD|nr:phosphopantetheine-binding protein [Desulfobulbus propionicus]ADW19299.1 phosphopantetheine-binding protein [Desulfobulbus propionicus DSM 2032]
MAITIADLKQLMLAIDLDEEMVSRLDPNVLLSEQGFDSIDYPAFALAVEERYGVRISDAEALRLKTLADFEHCIKAKV